MLILIGIKQLNTTRCSPQQRFRAALAFISYKEERDAYLHVQMSWALDKSVKFAVWITFPLTLLLFLIFSHTLLQGWNTSTTKIMLFNPMFFISYFKLFRRFRKHTHCTLFNPFFSRSEKPHSLLWFLIYNVNCILLYSINLSLSIYINICYLCINFQSLIKWQ